MTGHRGERPAAGDQRVVGLLGERRMGGIVGGAIVPQSPASLEQQLVWRAGGARVGVVTEVFPRPDVGHLPRPDFPTRSARSADE
ncbi:MAG: hypothetical protein EBR86_00565 [Planctomycetia bacterium]|nr:hypothetical protein [Planctomycetia bacterium]